MTAQPHVEIYATRTCPFCHRAKALLADKGIAFDEIDVGARPERRAEMMQRAHGRRTVPQIFIGGQHIGGCDELYALEEDGKLEPLLVASPA